MNNFNSRILASAAALSFNAGLAIAVDTVLGVRGIPESSSLLKDFNNDQIITDADIVLQLLSILGDGPDADRDGDGVSTALDTVLAVEEAVKSSCGDLDKSGNVNLEDVDEFLVGFVAGDYSIKYDVNADGFVDSADLSLIFEKLELQDIVYLDGRAGVWLPSMLVRARLEGDTALWLDQSATRKHNPEISEGWADTPPHSLSTSLGVWPANHERSSSLSWPSSDHGFISSNTGGAPAHVANLSVLWPANHLSTISATWIATHQTEISYSEDVHNISHSSSSFHNHFTSYGEYNHRQERSELWTRPHDQTTSTRWNFVPNHVKRLSNTWDRNFDGTARDHDVFLSRRWPPNHLGIDSRSNLKIPRKHLKTISDGWIHGTFQSNAWPPMHSSHMSTNWGVGGHTRALSFVWPPNHHGAVSGQWPPRISPGTWPANHNVEDSNQTSVPVPIGPADWPLWPANHDWFTTIREFSEIPDNITDPFVP